MEIDIETLFQIWFHLFTNLIKISLANKIVHISKLGKYFC